MDDDDEHDDLHARFEGGENSRGGGSNEDESDANWASSYAEDAENEVEEDDEEEAVAADEATSRKTNLKGKEKEHELFHGEHGHIISDDVEKVESDGDYEPSGDDGAEEEELPLEGTSQSAEMRKRKRNLDESGDDLKKSGRSCYKDANFDNVHFQVHNLGKRNERLSVGGNKGSGRAKRKFRKERKVKELVVDGEDERWMKSLQGPHLRLMVALKELAAERVKTIKEDSLYNCLTPAALRAIGIILEEHVKEQLLTLSNGASVDDGEPLHNGDSLFPQAGQSLSNDRGVEDVIMEPQVEASQTNPKKSRLSGEDDEDNPQRAKKKRREKADVDVV